MSIHPIKQKLRFNPKLGRLSLINDEKICFIGYKNFQISNLIHSDTINIQELRYKDDYNICEGTTQHPNQLLFDKYVFSSSVS